MKEQILTNIEYIFVFGLIIAATFFVAFLVNRFFFRLIKRSSEVLQNDPTNYQFLRHAIRAIVFLVGFSMAIYSVPGLKTVASSLLAGAGILAVAVGFAAQHAMSNVISGFFIVLFKPFKVNDRLTIRDTLTGIVEDITLRHTVIRNFENRRIIIPNSIISDEVVINSDFADDKICKWIDISISYDSDLDGAKQLITDEILNHPLHLDVRTPEQIAAGDPEVPVRVIALGEYSVNLRAWAWTKDSPDAFVLSCDVYESIKKRFDKEGIEIPYPHRTLVYKNKANILTTN